MPAVTCKTKKGTTTAVDFNFFLVFLDLFFPLLLQICSRSSFFLPSLFQAGRFGCVDGAVRLKKETTGLMRWGTAGFCGHRDCGFEGGAVERRSMEGLLRGKKSCGWFSVGKTVMAASVWFWKRKGCGLLPAERRKWGGRCELLDRWRGWGWWLWNGQPPEKKSKKMAGGWLFWRRNKLVSSGWRFQKLKPEVGGFFGSNEGCSVFLEEKGEDPCGLGCRPFICWLNGKKIGGGGTVWSWWGGASVVGWKPGKEDPLVGLSCWFSAEREGLNGLGPGGAPLFFCVDSPFKILYTWAKILFGPPNWSLNFLFFVKFDFSCFFCFFLKRAISTSTQMRKINDFKNDAWKVERVQKTLKKNLNSFFFFRRCWKC